VDGEGCFFVGLTQNSKSKVNLYVNLLFKINQHKRDIELLKKISMQLDCGTVQNNTEHAVMVQCKKLSDIETKIIPFFEKYPLQGVKILDYKDFCRARAARATCSAGDVFYLMQNKEHLTEQGLDKIRKIKSGMNLNRYREKDNSKDASKVNKILQSSFFCYNLDSTYLKLNY
jgi:hypothetical protein